MSEALYRKYRPQIFEDVVGQEHIERTLKNAIEQDKVSHAYLFTGPRGTGKTTTARLLAKALLCEKGPTSEPDGTCDDCVMIANGEHPDVYELDAASRTGVENVREEIIGRVQFAPTRGRSKVYIIDEVHMLSTAAFNALLKTLEEPPSHVVFILATTDPQKVPETIHSRCQRFDFRRISAEAIVSRLGAICVSEGVEFEGEALDLIAHRAEGGMRNALTSLEQLIAFGEGKVTLEVAERLLGALDTNDLAEIVAAIGQRDAAACFRWTADYIETGADLAQFTRDLAEHIRNLYVLTLAGGDVALEVSEATRRELAHELQWFGPDRLARLLAVLGDLSAELKTSTNPRLSFEIALTRMIRPDSDLTLASLAERVEALESGYSATAHVIAAPALVPAQGAAPTQPAANAVAQPVAQQASVAAQQSAASQTPSENPARASQSAPTMPAENPAGPTQPTSAEPHAAAQVAPSAQGAQPVAQQPAENLANPSPSPSPEPHAAAQTAQPAVQPVQPASGVRANLTNPAALQRVWQAALAALKKNKAAYGVLLLNTKALYDEARQTLVVEFPAENSFAYKAVQKPDVMDALGEAIKQACGEPLPFQCVQAGAGASGTAQPAAAAAEVAAQPQPQAQPASAQPQPEPQPTSAAQQPQPQRAEPAAVAQPQPQPEAIPVPDPDPVPYDDLPPYEDEIVPYDDYAVPAPSSATAPEPAPAQVSAPTSAAPEPAPEPAASTPTPGAPASAASAPAANASSESPSEIEALLASSFGGPISLRPVDD